MTVLINGVEYVPAYRPKPGAQFESLGHALRTIRKAHKLSLESAAKLAGCTKSHLWTLEKDGAEPGIRLAYRLSEAYGVPLLILALCAQAAPAKTIPSQGTGGA